jgi:hypothetical protein
MKWNQRSTVAFAAAALLSSAGVAIAASSTATSGNPGSPSTSYSSPTPEISVVLDDSSHGGMSARSGSDGVGMDEILPFTADDPAMHDVGDDNGSSRSGSDDNGSGGHGTDD